MKFYYAIGYSKKFEIQNIFSLQLQIMVTIMYGTLKS